MKDSDPAISGLYWTSSSEKHDESWLNEERLVLDDRAVDGLDSGSGLDSQLFIQSMVHLENLEGVSDGGSLAAGVLGVDALT